MPPPPRHSFSWLLLLLLLTAEGATGHSAASHYSCGLCERFLSLAGRAPSETDAVAAVAGYCAEVPKHGACALISESAVIDYYHHHRQASSSPLAACQSLGLCALEEPYQSQMRSGTNLSFDLRVAKGYGPRGYSTVRVSAVVNGNGGQPLPELEAAASLNFTYRSPFLHRWQDRYLYSTVLDLGEELSATLNIGGAAVNVSLPAEGAAARAALIADPCFSSRYMQCTWKRRFDSFERGTGFINALAADGQAGGPIDTWQILGDNFYDKDGNLTAIWFDQLTLAAKSKVASVAMGNHDYWMLGEPRGAAADDDYGNGKMQYYAMDSAFAYNNSNNNNSSSSSKVEEDDEEVFDFSVDPDDPSLSDPSEKIPAVANAVWYHTVGNMGFIGYSGAYSLEQVTPYLQEACQWMGGGGSSSSSSSSSSSNNASSNGSGSLPPAATFLVGHWNEGGMGCDEPMDVPDLYARVKAMPGCDAMGDSLRYVMGHTHCNVVTAPEVGFMVAGMGMEAFTDPVTCQGGGANFGIPVVDTNGGRVRIHYFPLDTADEYDAALSCVQEKGVANCYDLATLWLDAPYFGEGGMTRS